VAFLYISIPLPLIQFLVIMSTACLDQLQAWHPPPSSRLKSGFTSLHRYFETFKRNWNKEVSYEVSREMDIQGKNYSN
jgi:hypothetical protein